MRNRIADLPAVTLYALDGPPPDAPPAPPPLPSKDERRRRALVDCSVLSALAASGRPMSASELRFKISPNHKVVGPVREACERLVAEGRLTFADSPSSFTASKTVRHYALAPRPSAFDALLAKVRDRRVGPAGPLGRAKGGPA